MTAGPVNGIGPEDFQRFLAGMTEQQCAALMATVRLTARTVLESLALTDVDQAVDDVADVIAEFLERERRAGEAVEVG